MASIDGENSPHSALQITGLYKSCEVYVPERIPASGAPAPPYAGARRCGLRLV